ncbi:ABC transporter permease [Paradesulfitobacterium aromaticivorans]
MKTKFVQHKYIQRIFWICLLLVLWEVVAHSGKYSPLIFPSLEQIFSALYHSILNGNLLKQVVYTLKLILEGFVIALVLAVVLSVLGFASKIVEGLVETLLAIAHPLPGLALLPLIILWLGTGANSVIFIIVHSVIWPLLLNLLIGFKSIPKIYKQVGQNYELGSVQIAMHIMIPAALPYFIAGLKTGWARAWRAVIGAEMVFGAAGGTGGIGWFIFTNRVFMDTAGMFAGIFVIILIGVLVEDLILNRLEKATVKKWGMTI